MKVSKGQCTAAIQKSIETGERHPLSHFDSRKYIQHNLMLEDGLAAIFKFMDALPRDRTRVEVACAFEDGEHSVALAAYELGDWGRMAGFEVHRWEDGKIVEHWDNLQPWQGPNDSARAMTDGRFRSDRPMAADAARRLVEDFVTTVLIAREHGSTGRFFADDQLVQHSPRHGDGAGRFVRDLTTGPIHYEALHKVLGDGELVLAMSEGRIGQAHSAFYNLFRIDGERIAEHWEVIETILPRDQWKNDNGKF